MNGMKHRHIQKQLSAYLDDELNVRDCEGVEAHLRTCEVCAELLSDLKQHRQWMVDLRQPAPPGIWEAVRAQLMEADRASHPSRDGGFSRFWHRWLFRPISMGVGAAVTACLILMWVYFNPLQKPSEVQDALDLYVMAHAEYATYSLLTAAPAVSQSFTIDASPSGLDDAQTETVLSDETEIFLDVYLGN